VAFLVTGCKKNRASVEQEFAEAHLQFERGYTDLSLKDTQRGEQNSAAFPDLNLKFRTLQAEIYVRTNKPQAALDLLSAEPSSSIPAPIQWRRKIMQASAFCRLNQDSQASQLFGEAAQIANSDLSLNAETLFFRGRCQFYKNNLPEAEKYFQQVLASGRLDDYIHAWSLATLGHCNSRSGRFEDALGWYIKARSEFSALKALPLEEGIIGNTGYVYLKLQDMPRAKENLEHAIKMAEELNLQGDEQLWLLDVGNIYINLGQSGAAEEALNKALSIPIPPGSTANAVKCLDNLIGVSLGRKRIDQAEKYLQAAMKLGPTGNDLFQDHVREGEIASAKGEYQHALDLLGKLLVEIEKPGAEKLDFRQVWRIQLEFARIYSAQGKDHEAEIWFQKSIATVKQAAAAVKSEEFSSSILGSTPLYDDYVGFLVSRGQKAKSLQFAQAGRAITLAHALGLSSRQEDPDIWLAKIKSYLGKRKSVLFSYFLTDNGCYLWAITPKELRMVKLGIKGPELVNLIDSYTEEIRLHTDLANSTAARKLFQLLVQPANDLAPKGSQIIILADSQLYSVNFETLVSTQGRDHYWIEDVAVENASSIDLLLAGIRNTRPTKGMLLIGDAIQADPNFPVLPNAAKEMESVSRHFSPSEVTELSGKDATPKAYLSNSPGNYKYIHFATHGKSDPMDALHSAIILSRGPAGNFKLYASDIIDSKVQLNADLVTISACEGAGERIQSLEGLLGLEWAFMRVGAHQIVAALWDVDDTVTPGLMDDFYRELKKGKTSVEALRHAKLGLLHAGGSTAAPYYWATLQLYIRS